MTTAVRATSRTLAELVQAELAHDPELTGWFSASGPLGVFLSPPTEMTGVRAGLAIWLYRVTFDDAVVNRSEEPTMPTRAGPALPPLRLHYLFAPMTGPTTKDPPATEQVILGRILQCLHDHPQLRGSDLKDDFAGTGAVITLRHEPLTADQLARIWIALDTSYRTSVCYTATVLV